MKNLKPWEYAPDVQCLVGLWSLGQLCSGRRLWVDILSCLDFDRYCWFGHTTYYLWTCWGFNRYHWFGHTAHYLWTCSGFNRYSWFRHTARYLWTCWGFDRYCRFGHTAWRGLRWRHRWLLLKFFLCFRNWRQDIVRMDVLCWLFCWQWRWTIQRDHSVCCDRGHWAPTGGQGSRRISKGKETTLSYIGLNTEL